MSGSSPSVGVAIITHCAKKHLHKSLPPYLNSPLKPRVLVVNSSSNDGTVEMAQAMGAETLLIPRKEFNHGSTREAARSYLGTDIVVMATPDAYARDASTLELLLQPIFDKKASVSYARQIPHVDADFFESFPRQFNYPEESQSRNIFDIPTYGIYTFFCSNSCAAYCNKALEKIGGFDPVLLGEDTVAVAKLLHLGHTIAYVADAQVHHSHRYSLKEEFCRSFDIGLARKGYRHLLLLAGGDHRRGQAYAKALASRLWQEKPSLLPYAALQTILKWIGYKWGEHSTHAPKWLKKICSSQDFYWN